MIPILLTDHSLNGELKSSAEFTVKGPQAKITNVLLSSEINDLQEPGNPSTVFSPQDTIYVFIQLDFLVPGDSLKSRWLDESGNVILETPFDVTMEYYQPSWINFSMSGSEGQPIPAGKYTVEIYFNGQLFGSYPFEVAAEYEAGSVTFDQENYFVEAKDKYNFIIMYPDFWEPTWQEDNTGMSVNFYPPTEEEAVSLLMLVLNKGSYPDNENDFESFITEIADNTRGDMQQVGEPVFTEKKLNDNSTYAEIIYYFNDPSKGDLGLILSIFAKNEKMYIWYGFAHETFYDALNTSYYTCLNSLEFN